MSTARYPNLLPESIEMLVSSTLDSLITPAVIDAMTEGRANRPDAGAILADLDRAHMIDENQTVTPLGAAVARMWRKHLAKTGAASRFPSEPV